MTWCWLGTYGRFSVPSFWRGVPYVRVHGWLSAPTGEGFIAVWVILNVEGHGRCLRPFKWLDILKETIQPTCFESRTHHLSRWAWLGRGRSSLRPISLSAKWNFSGLFWGWGVGMLMAALCPWHWDSWDNKCHCHYCQRDRPLRLRPLPISLHSLSSASPMCVWPSSVHWSCGQPGTVFWDWRLWAARCPTEFNVVFW